MLVAAILLSVRASREQLQREARVHHSLEMLNRLEDVLSVMIDAETGQRGFIITGREDYLEPYTRAAGRIDSVMNSLAAMARDDSLQQPRIAMLRRLADQRLAIIRASIDARRYQGFNEAQAIILTNRGRRVMDALRRTVATMEATENAQLGERARSSTAMARSTSMQFALASFAVAAALIVCFTVARRGLALQRRADHERVALLKAERQARAAAEAASAANDNFLAVASHELRTPITSLRLQVSIVARAIEEALKSPPERAAAALERIRSHTQVLDTDGRRMGDLVDRLLDVTRIASGQFDLHPEPADLGEIVRAAVAAMPQERSGDPPITIDVPPDLSGQWDKRRLEQVVVNLVSNALRYGEGQPILVRARAGDADVTLEVRDNGPGIAPQQQAQLFQRFGRGSAESGGLGLGLYIARRIAREHGGDIDVATEPGLGTTFTVRLPRVIPAERSPAPA